MAIKNELVEIKPLLDIFNFNKKLTIPLKIIKDYRKFFDKVLPNKEFLLIIPNNVEIVQAVSSIRHNVPHYIIISDTLENIAILIY